MHGRAVRDPTKFPEGPLEGRQPRRWNTNNPQYPYYYTYDDDPGYGYIPDYDDPRNAPRRYKIEDIIWLISEPAPEITRQVITPQEPKEMAAAALEGVIGVTYGEDAVGGSMIDLVPGVWNDGGVKSGQAGVYGISQGEIDSILETQLGPEYLIPGISSGVMQRFYPGTLTQAVDADLQAMHQARGDGAVYYRYPGLAYAGLFVPWYGPDSILANWIKPTFRIKGKKVYDPRLGLSGGLPSAAPIWRSNGPLALADWLYNPFYGLGAGLGGIVWESFSEGADYCDETVGAGSITKIAVNPLATGMFFGEQPPTLTLTAPPPGGRQATAIVSEVSKFYNGYAWSPVKISLTDPGEGYLVTPTITWSYPPAVAPDVAITMGEKRFTFNMSFLRSASHKAIIDTMRAHFRGYIFKRRGKYVLSLDKPRGISMVLDGTNSRPVQLRREGFSEVPNRVIVAFLDKENDKQVGRAIAETAAVTAGTEAPRTDEYALHGYDSIGPAIRQAYYFLNKGLLNLNASVVGMKAIQMKLEPTDRVTYDSTGLGLGGQDFSINLVGRNSDNEYNYELGMYDEAIFADRLAVTVARVRLSVQDPTLAPPPITNPNITLGLESIDLFEQPKIRDYDPLVQVAANYTNNGTLNYNAARIRDENEALEAFRFPVATVSSVTLDCLVATRFDEFYFTILTSVWDPGLAPTANTPSISSLFGFIIQHADSLAGPWTTSGGMVGIDREAPAGTRRYFCSIGDAAAHRYWRIESVGNASNNGLAFSEATFKAISDDVWLAVKKYRIYDRTLGLIAEHDAPPVTGGIGGHQSVRIQINTINPLTNGGSITNSRQFFIAAVNAFDREGPLYRVSTFSIALPGDSPGGVQQTWIPQNQQDITLANGTNNDVGSDFSMDLLHVTGPTANYLVTGFIRNHGGRAFVYHNDSAFTATLKNQDAGSTAANRIITPNGVDYHIQPGAMVWVIWNAIAQRWLVVDRFASSIQTDAAGGVVVIPGKGTHAEFVLGGSPGFGNAASRFKREITGATFNFDILISDHPSASASNLRIFTHPGATLPSLMIDSAGRVGIGRSAPSVRLHVGLGGTGTQAEQFFIDAGSGAAGQPSLHFLRNSVMKATVGIVATTSSLFSGSVINDLAIVNTQAIGFSTDDGATRILGIGTTTMTLGKGGTGGDQSNFIIDAGSATGGHPWISLQRNAVEKAAHGVAGSAGAGIAGSAVGDFFLRVASAQEIHISADGGTTRHVTIGTTGKFTQYAGLSCAGFGLAAVRAQDSRVGQTAQVGPITLLSSVAAGVYRATLYIRMTQAATGGTIMLQVNWNDGTATLGGNPPNLDATQIATPQRATVEMHVAAATNITFFTQFNAVTGSPIYLFDVIVERIA